MQLGSVHRLRTIFQTNLRTSYAAGQWERIQRVKDDLPFLRYSAVLDSRTRPDHRRWHGTVLPVDHPFWQTHFPPNGWRCRCSVTQFSESPPAGWDRTRPWVNDRTGIDSGWNHNTGLMASQQRLNRLVERLDDRGLDPGLARAEVRKGIKSTAFLDFLSGRHARRLARGRGHGRRPGPDRRKVPDRAPPERQRPGLPGP